MVSPLSAHSTQELDLTAQTRGPGLSYFAVCSCMESEKQARQGLLV